MPKYVHVIQTEINHLVQIGECELAAWEKAGYQLCTEAGKIIKPLLISFDTKVIDEAKKAAQEAQTEINKVKAEMEQVKIESAKTTEILKTKIKKVKS